MGKKYLKSTNANNYNNGSPNSTKCEIVINDDKMELVSMLSLSGEHLKYGSRKYIKREY